LLASEGIRPGAIGNIALTDFNWAGKREHGYIRIKDNTSKRSKKLSTSTPVQKGATSNQNYNSEITIKIWPTTAEAIQKYIDTERLAVTTRGLRNRSEGFLFLAEHGGPIGDRGTITSVFRRAGKGLAAMGLLCKDAGDPYLQGEVYDFDAYLLRHSAASFFYGEKVMEMQADVVMNLMEQRFGWVKGSAMPSLYAQRAMSDAASVTVEDFVESLFAEARVVKSIKGEGDEHSQAGGRAGGG
jgi:integrase